MHGRMVVIPNYCKLTSVEYCKLASVERMVAVAEALIRMYGCKPSQHAAKQPVQGQADFMLCLSVCAYVA